MIKGLFASKVGYLFCQRIPRRRGLRIVRDGVFFFKANAASYSLRRSSSPTAPRFAGLAVGFSMPALGIYFVNTAQAEPGRDLRSQARPFLLSYPSRFTMTVFISDSQGSAPGKPRILPWRDLRFFLAAFALLRPVFSVFFLK